MSRSISFLKRYALPIKCFAALLIFAALFIRMDWSQLETMTHNISLGITGIALALIVGQLLLLAYRWQIFMNAEKNLVNYQVAVNITTASQLANFLFITSVGGIVVRIALARHYGMSLLKAICAAVTDRFMTLLSIVVFAVLFIPALSSVLPKHMFEGLIIMTGIGMLTALLFPSMLIGFLKPIIMKNRALASSVIYLRRLIRKPHLITPVLISSFIAQLAYFLAVCFAGRSIGLEFSTTQMIAMLPMITLISSLPIGLGGWGIREGAFVFGLALIGIPAESAFLISVQIGLLGILSTIIVAIPALMTGSMQSIFRSAVQYKLKQQR